MENKKTNPFAETAQKRQEERRGFLKKAAYTAPVLIVMGQLVKPEKIHADGTGGPAGPPGGWNPW